MRNEIFQEDNSKGRFFKSAIVGNANKNNYNNDSFEESSSSEDDLEERPKNEVKIRKSCVHRSIKPDKIHIRQYFLETILSSKTSVSEMKELYMKALPA